jgi:hypothetical protein
MTTGMYKGNHVVLHNGLLKKMAGNAINVRVAASVGPSVACRKGDYCCLLLWHSALCVPRARCVVAFARGSTSALPVMAEVLAVILTSVVFNRGLDSPERVLISDVDRQLFERIGAVFKRESTKQEPLLLWWHCQHVWPVIFKLPW